MPPSNTQEHMARIGRLADENNWREVTLSDAVDDYDAAAWSPQDFPFDENGSTDPLFHEPWKVVAESITALREHCREIGEQLEFDRSAVADCLSAANRAIDGRYWLTEGRGPYEWNDDNWHKEFFAAAIEIKAAIAPLTKIATSWKDCPQSGDDVARARVDLKAENAALREQIAEMERDWRPLDAVKYVATELRQCQAQIAEMERQNLKNQAFISDLIGERVDFMQAALETGYESEAEDAFRQVWQALICDADNYKRTCAALIVERDQLAAALSMHHVRNERLWQVHASLKTLRAAMEEQYTAGRESLFRTWADWVGCAMHGVELHGRAEEVGARDALSPEAPPATVKDSFTVQSGPTDTEILRSALKETWAELQTVQAAAAIAGLPAKAWAGFGGHARKALGIKPGEQTARDALRAAMGSTHPGKELPSTDGVDSADKRPREQTVYEGLLFETLPLRCVATAHTYTCPGPWCPCNSCSAGRTR